MATSLVKQEQVPLVPAQEPSAMQLLAELAKTSDPQVAVVVAQQIANLKIQMDEHSWNSQERQSKIDFDDALTNCQKEIERIAPDKEREKGIKWATYAAIDRDIRPKYTAQNFAISFSQETPSAPDRMAVVAFLTRSGISKDFHREIPIVVPGSTSRADAEEAAFSRAQRYLVMRIFNISVGIDAAEMKPYETKPEDLMDEGAVMDYASTIEEAGTIKELETAYFKARDAAKTDQKASKYFAELKNSSYRRITGGKR